MKRQMMVRIKEVKYMLRLENVNRILASVSEENNLKNRITIRGRTYSTHCEVLVLVLGVEPEPTLVVVL